MHDYANLMLHVCTIVIYTILYDEHCCGLGLLAYLERSN